MSQQLFDFIAQADQAAADQRHTDHISDHIRSMRCCWPDWNGPRVDDSTHGYCSVHTGLVFSITHNEKRSHYMAPCRIESISEDGMNLIAVIDYNPSSHCAIHNGERLRLHITDVWPPVQRINSQRHAAAA